MSLSEALERGQLEAAERKLEAICEEWREQVGSDGTADQRLEWARSLHALGVVERTRAKPGEAAGHLRKALGLYPAGSAGAIDAGEALALTLQDLGEFDEAESRLRECLRQRAAGGPHADRAAHANTRDHLALLLLVRGDYEEAGSLLEASLAETPPGDAMARARRHGYLGRYRHTLGSYARAHDHADSGLEGLNGLDPTSAVADRPARRELRLTLLSQRALARFRLGREDAAREDFEAAADEARRHHALGAPALVAIPHLNNLGALELAAGDTAAAVRHFREALGLIDAGPDHPARIPLLNNLGSTLLAEGKYEESRRFLLEAARLQRRHLPPVHLRVAETRRNLALNAMLSGDPRAAELVREANQVGLALLERLVRHGSEIERLNFLQRIDLVSLSCAGGDAATIADLLIASKSRLLDAMLGAEPAAAPGWREVRDALPAGSAFIDFCRHHPPDGEARYGAVVIAPGVPPRWVPLGREPTLQTWLGSLQRRLAWKSRALAGHASAPPPLRCRGILRQLHREFWQPLAEALPEATRDLVVSPDGALHFLPFAVLTDADGHFLCDRVDRLSSVASGRDLLDSSAPAPLGRGSWLALGVTDFSAVGDLAPRPVLPAASPTADHPSGHPSGRTQADPGPLTRALQGLGPMPGTRREIDLLRRLAPANSTFLTGPQASEDALRRAAPAHRLLHLGSHAIFLAPESPPPPFGIDFDLQADRLFASAIVLTGAGRRPDGAPLPSPHDDLLFPAEIARLPLGGTRLVTLSSCESGLGTAVAGEGVLGLRRAFHIAGAREVIVSLWPVSDLTTPEFMERFYRLALSSDRPGQALWQTQREFLATSRAGLDPEAAILRHAPFVLSQRACPPSSAPIPDHSPIPLRHWLLPALPLAIFLLARLSLRVAGGR